MFRFVLLMFLFVSSAEAKEYYGPYQADVVRVVDGDTVELAIHVWPGLVQTIKLRLDGVNTPEKRGKNVSQCEKEAGNKATAFTEYWLSDVETVTVDKVFLGKFAGRAIGQILKGDESLSDALISAGHGKHYSGGKRQPWC